MTRAHVTLVVVAGATILLAGCGRDWKLEVESNTSWYGQYGGVTGSEWAFAEGDGTGSQTIDLPDDDRVCCAFQQLGAGYLKVKIYDDGGGLFHLMAESDRGGETNLPSGWVELCSEGSVPEDYE